jgi:hypothetical protein
MDPPRRLHSGALLATPRKNCKNGVQNVRTNADRPERHSQRIYLRATPTEIEALDLLVLRWGASRSKILRSLVIGAALAECDRLDALDAAEAGFDLIDVPSVDVLAGL